MNNNSIDLRKNLYCQVYNTIILRDNETAQRYFNDNKEIIPIYNTVKDIKFYGNINCLKELATVCIAYHRNFDEMKKCETLTFLLDKEKEKGVDFFYMHTSGTTKDKSEKEIPIYISKYQRYNDYLYDDVRLCQYNGVLTFRSEETADDIEEFKLLNIYFEKVKQYVNTSGKCIDKSLFKFKYKNTANLLFGQKPMIQERMRFSNVNSEFLDCLMVYGAVGLLSAHKILHNLQTDKSLMKHGFNDELNQATLISLIIDVANPTFQKYCPEIYKILSENVQNLLGFNDEMMEMSNEIASSTVLFGLLEDDKNIFDSINQDYKSISFRITTKSVEDSEVKLNIAYQQDRTGNVHDSLMATVKKINIPDLNNLSNDGMDINSIEPLISEMAKRAGYSDEEIQLMKQRAKEKADMICKGLLPSDDEDEDTFNDTDGDNTSFLN